MSNVDTDEIQKFEKLASRWWDPHGEFRPLHDINPLRLGFINERAPLAGKRVLDVGCGGGLLAESMAKLGAEVLGIDPAPENVEVAERHAAAMELPVRYLASTVEDLPADRTGFDVVTALEVVEHLADVPGFLAACAARVRPGGVLVLSTLNRTARSYALGIVAAERILGWLPAGTHDWRRFLKPSELAAHLRAVGLRPVASTGLGLDPQTAGFRPVRSLGVNYLMLAEKPA